jgi:hypothetical protein
MAEPAARPLRMDRHMSDAEALMWQVERDPVLRRLVEDAFEELSSLEP